jgi:hypothetical protein
MKSMNELIWFSIPGAIVILPIALIISDRFLCKDWVTGLIIVGVPVLGFIIHQFWRFMYEFCGGYSSRRRIVIKTIKNNFGITKSKDAFLIWEITFYKQVDESFRAHDRGAWHYIMSFYSCMLASIFSILIMLLNFSIIYSQISNVFWILIILYLLVGILFIGKAKLTGRSLEDQEKAILTIDEIKFKQTAIDLKLLNN